MGYIDTATRYIDTSILFDLWQASLPENIFFKTYSQARTLREACGGGYGKRPVSNVNKRAKMFAVCAWTQIPVELSSIDKVSLV